MPDFIFLPIMAAMTYLGFALLALNQDRHWDRVEGRRTVPDGIPGRLRGLGYALLAGTLALAVGHEGAGFGPLLWATMLSFAAITVVCTLTWRAWWLRPLTRLFHHR